MKDIEVLDNVLDYNTKYGIYEFVKNSLYQLGLQDTGVIENSQHMYFNSAFSENDNQRLGLLQKAKENPQIANILANKKWVRTFVNLSVPSEAHFHHVHSNATVLLYYVNLDWKPEWEGETIFYNKDVSDIVYTSMYTPGRIIIFNGNIPHTIRAQSSIAPFFRFTISNIFE